MKRVKQHIRRDEGLGNTALCGTALVRDEAFVYSGDCLRCRAIESKRLNMAQLAQRVNDRNAARLTEETGVTHRWDAADGRMVREDEDRLTGPVSFELTETGRAKVAASLAGKAQGNVITSNPHYACDTHGATCPTGEHVSHTAGNPYPGCDRCAEETPADRHMTGRCREVIGTHCHCALEYGMPDGERRPCLACEPNAPVYVETGVCACGVRLASGVPGRIAEIAEACSHTLAVSASYRTEPVPSYGFQVQGRRGGEWFNVPREAFLRLDLAIGRADILADMIEDSEFRVINTATGEVAYQRSKRAVPSPVGWPGASMVSGRADYAREPKQYRRCKGTRRDRRQCRGGWGK